MGLVEEGQAPSRGWDFLLMPCPRAPQNPKGKLVGVRKGAGAALRPQSMVGQEAGQARGEETLAPPQGASSASCSPGLCSCVFSPFFQSAFGFPKLSLLALNPNPTLVTLAV